MRNHPGPEPGSVSIDEQKRIYDQAFRGAQIGAWECDLASERLIWTDGIYRLFDLPVGSTLKRAAILDLYVDESRHAMELMRAEAILSGQGFSLETEIRTPRGEKRWMRLSAEVIWEDGRPARLFGAKRNITAEREAWIQLRQVAERDPLTGLANRRVFEARYRDVTTDTLNHGSMAALVLVDIDHFKQVNDGIGHAAGDECLRQVAIRLQKTFAGAGLVARLGGDEFAILLRAPLGPTRIAHMLRNALPALRNPILWDNKRIGLSVSIGARIIGQPRGRRLTDLYEDADAALYAAKAAGRDTLCIFGDELLSVTDQSSVPVQQIRFRPVPDVAPHRRRRSSLG